MKKKKIAIVICTTLFIYFVGGIIYSFINKNYNEDLIINEQIGDTIKNYNYILYKNDLEIYTKEFKHLKQILEKKEIDYKEYAISISKLFLIDLYNLDNKNNKYDIGGIEFIYPDILDNYKLKVENTLYKYIIDNSNNDRKQELPIVKNVELEEINEMQYNLNGTTYEAYKLNLYIEYKKDLEYDKEAEIIVIKKDKYLYIVEKN